jgi:hypothetical protein
MRPFFIGAAASALLAVLFLPAGAAACTSDLECGAAARCVKSAGAIYGQCLGDPLPQGALGAASPVAGASPQQAGCSFDGDCGTGRVCLMTSGNAAGVCVSAHAPPAR